MGLQRAKRGRKEAVQRRGGLDNVLFTGHGTHRQRWRRISRRSREDLAVSFMLLGWIANEYDRPTIPFPRRLRPGQEGWVLDHSALRRRAEEHTRNTSARLLPAALAAFEGADRIDHGLNAIERPELIQIIKQRGLGLTLCPPRLPPAAPNRVVYLGVSRSCGTRVLG